MKKKLFSVLLLSLMLAATVFAACSDAVTYEVSEESLKVWLDRYDEQDVELTKGDKNALTWTSLNEEVATVNKGKIIATGKGETVVKVKDKSKETDIQVVVRDSGIKPQLAFATIDAYLNEKSPLPQKVKYASNFYQADLNYKVVIEDTSVVSFEDNKLQGKKLASTKASVETLYKGLTLKKNITISVKNALEVEFDSEKIELFKVDTKKGRYNIEVKPTFVGQKIDVKPQYQIIGAENIIKLEDNTIVAVGEGEADVSATINYNGAVATDTLKVKVFPNYKLTEFKPSGEENIVWEQTSAKIGDREGKDYAIMKYQPASNIGESDGDGDHIFSQRVEEVTSGVSLTDLYAQGFRYFAYDLYFDCLDPWLMEGVVHIQTG